MNSEKHGDRKHHKSHNSSSREKHKKRDSSKEKSKKHLLKITTQKNQLQDLKEKVSFILDKEKAPMMGFQKAKNRNEDNILIHWGQRKLFISELWFLTQYGHLGKSVVYAGAAAGTHIPFLASLFPEHHFILVDPSKFIFKNLKDEDAITKAKERLDVRQEFFTDEMAADIANKHSDILFISDIRGGAGDKDVGKEVWEDNVRKDNMKQRDWINILKPKKSLLKFRCPFNQKENLKMFDGEVFLQPWAPARSAETRLVPSNPLVEVEWDNLKYENQLFYHNMITRREIKYGQPIQDGVGFNQRWDVSAEITILFDFLLKFPQKAYEEIGWYEKIMNFSEDISFHISLNYRTLETPTPPGKNYDD